MNWAVVVLDGEKLNITLAGIEYERWGQKNNQQIIVCDSWANGFSQACAQGYTHALFVRSGTVFSDWSKWRSVLDNYPHQGLIAHLIWHPDQQLYIDDQCWFADLKRFTVDDLYLQEVSHPEPIRSVENLHDNYTPLWVRPGIKTNMYTTTNFGQGLIAKQLNNGQMIVNWNNIARDLKFFCYPDTDVDQQIKTTFGEYLYLAENQLWVFNNEELTLIDRTRLVSPGSGLFWILSMLQSSTQEIQIVDISQTQINFCNELWNNWDGSNYGEFTWHFITKNQLIHFEIDQGNLPQLERLKLKNPVNFKLYVNQTFDRLLTKYQITDFKTQWTKAKQNKTLNLQVGNLVSWILAHPDDAKNLWTSNILDYKWTKLNTSWLDCKQFKELLQS